MIPTSVAAVISFLLLLAPGIVWELQRTQHEPAAKESALIEISRVILASLLATGAAAVCLLGFVWLPLYRTALDSASDPLASTIAAVPYIGAVLATSLLACGFTLIAATFKWRGRPPIKGVRVWHRAFVEWKPSAGAPPKLVVELLDGTVWYGSLRAFDSDPEDNQRGLALGSPLLRRRPDDEATKERPQGWKVVILPESQIKSIQVAYPPKS